MSARERPSVTVLLVALAGSAGVLARYGIAQAWASVWAIAAINVAGSFALGVVLGAGRDHVAITVGFLGGFTTFSTFSMHAVRLADDGKGDTAFLYVAVSVVLGVAAAAAGFYGTRALSAGP